MITDDELKRLFPSDVALMIPMSGAESAEVVVGPEAGQDEEPSNEFFLVWVNSYSELRVSRSVTFRDGGIQADSGIGPIFLRPVGEPDA